MSDLFDRWQALRARSGSRFAIADRAAGIAWTFADLGAALDRLPPLRSGAPHFAKPLGAGFVLETLRAWRDGALFCPVEAAAEPPDPALLAGAPAGIAHAKLTSGSTGAPRLVLFKAAQLAADADNIVATMGLRADLPNLGAISLAHSYGFSNLVLPLLLHGIPLVLADSPLPGAVEAALREPPPGTSGWALPAVPAMWRAWLAARLFSGAPAVEVAISAGAPLSLDLERAAFDQNVRLHNFLGSTECGGIAYDRSPAPRQDAALAGSAMDGVRLSIDVGRLCVAGPAVGETYWPEPSPDLGGGVFRAGDLAAIAPDGAVFLRGRAGDVINVAGRKLDPAEVEHAVAALPGVACCAVFGVPSADPERVHDIVACLAPAPGAGFDLAAAKRQLGDALPAWKLPRRWWIADGLKPDARGKVSRADWRRRYIARETGS